MDKWERLKLGSAEVSRKVTERVSSMSDRVREIFQQQTSNGAVDRIVEEATGSHGFEVDWGRFMEICDMVNGEQITGQDLARAIRKRMANAKHARCQGLVLLLLETVIKNCDTMFSEVSAEKILDEMVRLVDDPSTIVENRDKALRMIESWGEVTEELRYLPVFEETYKSLKARGIKFPPRDAESLAPIFTPPQSVEPSSNRTGVSRLTMRDVVAARPAEELNKDQANEVLDVARNSVELLSTVLSSAPQQEVLKEELTTTLVEQCRHSRLNVQRLTERAADNDGLIIDALSVNEELEKVLTKYEEILRIVTAPAATAAQGEQESLPTSEEPAFVIVDEDTDFAEEALVRKKDTARPSTDPLCDLDEMIFGSKVTAEPSSGAGQDKEIVQG